MQESADNLINQTFPASDQTTLSQVWIDLMASATSVEALNRCKLGYCDLLIAQDRAEEALAILDELYDSEGRVLYLHRQASVHQAAGRVQVAHDCLLRAFEAAEDPAAQAGSAYALGRSLLESHPQEAVDWLRRAIALAQDGDLPGLEGQCRQLLAQLALSRQETEVALYYLQSALDAFGAAGDARNHQQLTDLMQELGQPAAPGLKESADIH